MKILQLEELPVELREAGENYLMLGQLPDGKYCGILRLMFHWTIHVDLDWSGYGDRYCYHDLGLAVNAMLEWNGDGHPKGWNKYPKTGIYQDPATGETWSEDEPRMDAQ